MELERRNKQVEEAKINKETEEVLEGKSKQKGIFQVTKKTSDDRKKSTTYAIIANKHHQLTARLGCGGIAHVKRNSNINSSALAAQASGFKTGLD